MMRRFLQQIVVFALVFCAAAQAGADDLQLYPGEKVQALADGLTAKTQLSGWVKDGRGTVYTLGVKAGQKVQLDFKGSSKFAYLVIFDLAKPQDDAIFSSDVDGNVAKLVAKEDTKWLIRPFFSRYSSRRGLGAHYDITLDPQAGFVPEPPKPCGPLGRIC
jgi:hypothetical protein